MFYYDQQIHHLLSLVTIDASECLIPRHDTQCVG
jgi:hypothetical protein